jgi:hypothetical protein
MKKALLVVGAACLILVIAAAIYLYQGLPAAYRFGYSMEKTIENAGGVEALVSECYQLSAIHKEEFLSRTNYPPTIAALAPQVVHIRRIEPPLIDIQLSGGFYHHGLMVVCDSNALTFTPTKGQYFTIRKLRDLVFEYKE